MAQSLSQAIDYAQRRYGETPPIPEEPPEAGEAPPEEPTAEAPEAPPEEAPPAPEPPPEPPRPLKYKSQEEAEKGYRAAERRMHELAGENAQLQRELERLRQERDQERERATPKPPEPAPQKRRPGESMKQYIARMRTLDDQSDTYDDELSGIWGEAFRAELMPEVEALLSQRLTKDEVHALIHAAITEQLQQYDAKQRQETDQRSQQQKLYDDTVRLAAQAGLDLIEDGDTAEFFWAFAAKKADEQAWEEGDTVEDKIQYAIDYTRRFRGMADEPAAPPTTPSGTPPANGAPEPQQPLSPRRGPQPMSRTSGPVPGGVGTGSQEPERTRTLNDILEEQLNARRI